MRAGENDGRTLQHEFVVLALKKARLQSGTAEISLPVSAAAEIPHHALAVWAVRRGELTPLQATGGWLN